MIISTFIYKRFRIKIFIGLDGKFLVNGNAFTRLPELIVNHSLYISYFKNADFKAFEINKAYQTEEKKFDEDSTVYFQFKILDLPELKINREDALFLKEFSYDNGLEKESLLLPDCYFLDFLPKFYIENYSHWLAIKSKRIEFRSKSFENFNIKIPCRFYIDLEHMQMIDNENNKLVIMLNDKLFKEFHTKVFSRLDTKEYMHMLYDQFEKIFYFELPRHNLNFENIISSDDIISKEFIGYKIASSQNVNTFFGLNEGLVLDPISEYQNKKIIIPNASYQISASEIHQQIKADLIQFYQPSFFCFEIDHRLQIIKGEESIESWLFIAYLHAITSSIFPDPFLGVQGTVRSLQILQSGHCFSCYPLSSESIRILGLISELSPKRREISRIGHSIEHIVWPIGLSSIAASDLFILLSSVIIYQSNKLKFLYKEDQISLSSKNIETTIFGDIRKNLYYRSYCKIILQDYKLEKYHELIIFPKTSETARHIGYNYSWEKQNVKNVRKISTNSYSPDVNFHLKPLFLDKGKFNGYSEVSLDFTKFANLILIKEEFLDYWVDFYLFLRESDRTRVTITLSILAYLEMEVNHLLLLQKVLFAPDKLDKYQINFSDSYQDLAESKYKSEVITEILKVNCNVTPEDNPCKIKRNYGESDSQFNARIMFKTTQIIDKFIYLKENEIKLKWPTYNFEFYDNRFDSYEVESKVNNAFLEWMKNRDFKKFIEKITKLAHNVEYQIKNIELKYIPETQTSNINLRQFSIDHNSLKLVNIENSAFYIQCKQIFANGNLVIEGLVKSFSPEVDPLIYMAFPFEENESNSALETYFIKDLEKSWNCHKQDMSSKMTQKSVPNLDEKLNKLSIFYKKKSEELIDTLKSIIYPENVQYLDQAGLLPGLNPTKIISILRTSADTKISDNQELDPIAEICGAICVVWTLHQRVLRCLHYRRPESNQELALTRELENTPYLTWKPTEYPLWVILQVETDMMIRPVQVTVAKSMIYPESSKNTVMQLNMGEGKTSLIIPMIILIIANKKQIARLTVLKSLFNMNRSALMFKLGGNLNRRVYTVPCKRDIKFDRNKTEFINDVFKECLDTQGVLLTLPEFRFSFVLKGIELSRNSITAEIGKNLLTIQSRLDHKARDILDESDEILNPKYQLIYTIGKQDQIECGSLRWKVSQSILECMQYFLKDLHNTYPDCIDYNEYPVTPYRFPSIRLINQKPYEDLCKSITRSILLGKSKILDFNPIQAQHFDLVFSYITNYTITQEHYLEVSKLFKSNSNQFDIVILLKGLLSCQILLTCLLKRWRVNYGVNQQKKYLLQAVPFRAKDVPADKSQFAHPDIAILLTQLSYFYSGLNHEQLDQVFKRLDFDPDGSNEYDSWIHQISLNTWVHPSITSFKGINLGDKQQKEKILYPVIKFSQQAINYWLNHFLFPKEAKKFEGKLSLSFWDLCTEKEHPMTGFSGTNDSKLLLPLTVQNYDVEGLLGTNGSLIFNLLRPENKYSNFKVNISGSEIIDQIVSYSKTHPINVLLDVGALILELSNIQVVKHWLIKRPSAAAGVCFDDSNNLIVITRQGKEIPFEISPYRNHLQNCLIYLDDSHTRGTDLKIPKNSIAAVTLGKGVSKDKLMQGCMRMRMLGKGHSVMFFASHEVHDMISKKSVNDIITARNVLIWSLENTVSQTSDNFLYWGLQGISHYKRQVVYDKYFKTNESKDFKSRDYEDFSKYSAEPEISNIQLLYGRNRKETPIPQIITSKSAIIQNQLKATSVNIAKYTSLCQRLTSHSSTYVSNEKKFAHLLDEEQELELEVEVEIDAEIEIKKAILVKPEKHTLEKDVIEWFTSGLIPADSLVFHNLFKGLGITSLKKLSQPIAWSSKVFLTLDFMRTVDITKGGDDFLKPVKWIGYSGSAKSPNNLVVMSSYEANALIRDFKDGPVKIFLYSPRIRHNQMMLFNKVDAPISMELMQNVNVFAGNQYFVSHGEVDEYLKFIGYCPMPRTDLMERHYSKGLIKSNGYVEPVHRNIVFGKENKCEFVEDPGELILKIVDLRNFSISSKFGHHIDIILHCKKPDLKI